MATPDVAILGAGAAGLLAAIRAAERGRRVLLLERNKKAGVKVLMSGGTRCNVTHDASADEVLRAFSKRTARFLTPSIREFAPAQVIDFFERSGVPLKVEPPHGKVFPRSDRATDVQRALVGVARACGVELRCEARVVAVRRDGTTFRIDVGGAPEIEATRVIVATGGQSYPKVGTDGFGYGLARALGHTVVTPRPALVPLVLERPLPGCSGVALDTVRIGLAVAGGAILAARSGEVLFTHRGLSGPAALDLSGELTARTSGVVRDVGTGVPLEVALDLVPSREHEELVTGTLARGSGPTSVAARLHGLGLPRSLVVALLGLAAVPEARSVQELKRDERTALVRTLKDLRLAVTGTTGFDRAEVTAGGVALDEVDPRTLESKLVPGLYFIGEVLDVDGPIGGYNFQAAWSTGHAAGSVV